MAAQQQGPTLATPCFTSSSPASDAREKFVQELWPRPQTAAQATESITDLNPYFDHLRHECSPTFEQRYAVATFEDIVSIVEILRGSPNASFAEIRDSIQRTKPHMASQGLSVSIELAVRLWLMSNVRNVMPADLHQLQTSVPWPEDTSLQSVLQKHFTGQTNTSGGKFSEYLNFHDMKTIAGIRVEWTNNLAFHLTMKGSVIHVFHCVSVLKRMRESSATPSFLPQDMIDETLATIDLLAPLTNATCNSWLADEIRNGVLDRNIMHRDPPNLDRSRYFFWQEKLSIVEEAFAKSKPGSFFQWWYDRRDMQQWWGFWLVVAGIFLTVLFGLIQSVTGIIQVARPS